MLDDDFVLVLCLAGWQKLSRLIKMLHRGICEKAKALSRKPVGVKAERRELEKIVGSVEEDEEVSIHKAELGILVQSSVHSLDGNTFLRTLCKADQLPTVLERPSHRNNRSALVVDGKLVVDISLPILALTDSFDQVWVCTQLKDREERRSGVEGECISL